MLKEEGEGGASWAPDLGRPACSSCRHLVLPSYCTTAPRACSGTHLLQVQVLLVLLIAAAAALPAAAAVARTATGAARAAAATVASARGGAQPAGLFLAAAGAAAATHARGGQAAAKRSAAAVGGAVPASSRHAGAKLGADRDGQGLQHIEAMAGGVRGPGRTTVAAALEALGLALQLTWLLPARGLHAARSGNPAPRQRTAVACIMCWDCQRLRPTFRSSGVCA